MLQLFLNTHNIPLEARFDNFFFGVGGRKGGILNPRAWERKTWGMDILGTIGEKSAFNGWIFLKLADL